MGLLDRFRASRPTQPAPGAPDAGSTPSAAPSSNGSAVDARVKAAKARIKPQVDVILAPRGDWDAQKRTIAELNQRMRDQPPEDTKAEVLYLHERQLETDTWALLFVLTDVLRRKLPWTVEEVTWAFSVLRQHTKKGVSEHLLSRSKVPVHGVRWMPPAQRATVRDDLEWLAPKIEADRFCTPNERRTALKVIREALGGADPAQLPPSLANRSDQFGRHLAESIDLTQTGVPALLTRLGDLRSTSKPSKTWLKETGELVAATASASAVLRACVDAAVALRETSTRGEYGDVVWHLGIGDANETLLAAAAWALGSLQDSTPDLERLAVWAATGLGGSGGQPRSQRTATAALGALSSRPDAVPALARVQKVAKNKVLAKPRSTVSLEVSGGS